MFEKATRQKIRFETNKGSITTEDLWDLPLSSATGKVCLDDIAKSLYRQLKDSDDVSFVVPVQSTDELTQLKFGIVKHVITVRLAENEAANVQRANKERKQSLLALIAQKENEQLAGKSLDDLRAMVDQL